MRAQLILVITVARALMTAMASRVHVAKVSPEADANLVRQNSPNAFDRTLNRFEVLLFVDIDECESNPCQNDGMCFHGPGLYFCLCGANGFEGVNCEISEHIFNNFHYHCSE